MILDLALIVGAVASGAVYLVKTALLLRRNPHRWQTETWRQWYRRRCVPEEAYAANRHLDEPMQWYCWRCQQEAEYHSFVIGDDPMPPPVTHCSGLPIPVSRAYHAVHYEKLPVPARLHDGADPCLPRPSQPAPSASNPSPCRSSRTRTAC